MNIQKIEGFKLSDATKKKIENLKSSEEIVSVSKKVSEQKDKLKEVLETPISIISDLVDDEL